MTSQTAVTFENRNGLRLFGTVHLPAQPDSTRPLIVLLSPGVKMRVGPHRLYNRLTEAFTSIGFAVFKFDFHGLGDSEGELDRALLAEVYNDTECGEFVEDTIDALDWISEECEFDSFVLAGLCGGAITGILAAQEDKRSVGLLSLGMTVTLAMGARDRTKFASRGELDALRKGYFRQLFDPKSWLRLLTLRSDFSTIFRILKRAILPEKKRVPGNADGAAVLESNVNPRFAPAFFDVAESGRKVLMVFSESDRLYWDYQEKFAEQWSDRLATVDDCLDVFVVKQANHVFSFREWENEMLDVSCRWLRQNFGT